MVLCYIILHNRPVTRVGCAVEAHNQATIQLMIVQLLREFLKKRVAFLETIVQDLYIQYS